MKELFSLLIVGFVLWLHRCSVPGVGKKRNLFHKFMLLVAYEADGIVRGFQGWQNTLREEKTQ